MDDKQEKLDRLIKEAGNDELTRAWIDFLVAVHIRLDEILALIKKSRS